MSSDRYNQRGVSASKEDVHQAISKLDKGMYPKAFCKIVMTLGIRDSERAAFWNYLFRVIRFYPRDFAHGLTLAAMGYHFRQITEKYCD